MAGANGQAAWRDDAAQAAADLGGLVTEHEGLVTLLDRTAAMREMTARVRDLTGADLGYVADVDARNVLVMRAWSGTRGSALHGLEVPRGFGLGGKAFALVRPSMTEDYCASPAITHDFDWQIRDEGIGGMLAVPMVYDGEVLGVAYAALRQVGRFGTGAVSAVVKLCNEAAVAMHASDRAAERTGVAVAAERHRLAVTLHDSVGAMLFSIGAEVRNLRGAPELSQPVLDRLHQLEQHIAEAASALRDSMAALNQSAPAQRMSADITGDCRAFEARTGVPAKCISLSELPHLDSGRDVALVAAVREALLNVEKHAQASSVAVSLVAVDSGVAVAVADDGIGWRGADVAHFEAGSRDGTAPTGSARGLGLAAVLERLDRVGGRLSVVSNDDGGLTLRAWVPCLT